MCERFAPRAPRAPLARAPRPTLAPRAPLARLPPGGAAANSRALPRAYALQAGAQHVRTFILLG